MKPHVNILCLSGGGYRGLFTSEILSHIKRDCRVTDFRDHFDLIIGTSTGALVGSGLACGVDPAVISKAFKQFGKKIFPPTSSIKKLAKLIAGLDSYSRAPLIEAIRVVLEDKFRADLWKSDIEGLEPKGKTGRQCHLALVSLSRASQTHRVFLSGGLASRSMDPLAGADHKRAIDVGPNLGTPLYKAILASSAAPTYFRDLELDDDRLIDGGLVANAPVLIGTALVRKYLYFPMESIRVLHIGTGSLPRSESVIGPRAPLSQLMGATRGLVDLTMNAQEALARDLAHIWLEERYVQIDVQGVVNATRESLALDDASDHATSELMRYARETWEWWRDRGELQLFFPDKDPRTVENVIEKGEKASRTSAPNVMRLRPR